MSTLSMGKFRVAIFAAVIAASPLSLTSHAQDFGMVAKMNVPFAFAIGSKHYAPGVYTVRKESFDMVLVRGVSDSGFAMTQTDDGQRAKSGKAVFHKYGDQYFLSEISVTGSSRHIYVRPSKTEMALRIAGNKTAPTGVEIALLGKP
jgi:hypothetical protein